MPKATEPKKVKSVRELWEAGMSPAEIAEIMSLHVSTIHRILVRAGAREPDSSTGKRLSKEQKIDILKMYQEGMIVEDIMATIGCSKPTVYQYVKGAGLSRAIPTDAVAEAIRLYQESQLSVDVICKQTGISKPTFYRRLKKYIADKEA